MSTASAADRIVVRAARPDDAPALGALQDAWLAVGTSAEERRFGFLFGAPYSADDFLAIVADCTLVVAELDGAVVGYYLLDDVTSSPTSRAYGDHVERLVGLGLLPRVGVSRRASAVVSRPLHGLGISSRMLRALVERVVARHAVLFTIIAADNPRAIVHERAGWRVVDRDATHLYVAFDVRSAT